MAVFGDYGVLFNFLEKRIGGKSNEGIKNVLEENFFWGGVLVALLCILCVPIQSNAATKDANAKISLKVKGGGLFIREKSSAKVSFKLDKKSSNVVVCIKNSSEETVYKTVYKSCRKGKAYSFIWDGKKNGKAVNKGTYVVTVKAGKIVTTSEAVLTVYENEFSDGTGSKSNPFQVRTLEQFKAVERYNGCYFRQMEDITGDHTQIISTLYSDSSNPFTGNYDGNGYKISGLTIQDSNVENIALFGTIGANGALNQVQLEDIDVIGSSKGASVLAAENFGKISNCSVSNCNVSLTGYLMGFIVLYNQEGAVISGCNVSGCVASGSYGRDSYAGGLAVENYGTVIDSDVNSTSLKFTRTSTAYDAVAALTGLVRYNTGQMRNCHAVDVIISMEGQYKDYSSGICQENVGTITGCSFSGTAKYDGVETQNGIFQ
jgi:hypothetical protein